jgi:hypothetical protein
MTIAAQVATGGPVIFVPSCLIIIAWIITNEIYMGE